jgi:hypothetical protein
MNKCVARNDRTGFAGSATKIAMKFICWTCGIGLVLSLAACGDGRVTNHQPNPHQAGNHIATSASATGRCQKPNDIDALGHRCGGRAASERKGGR